MSILTFISPTHKDHNPPAEYLHGHAVPYYECPQRVDQILNALSNAGMIEKRQPPVIHPDVLGTTHDPNMIAYLQNLSNQSQAIIQADFAIYDLGNQLTGSEYYYESIFPAQMLRNGKDTRKTYIYDNTSPVGQATWQAALNAASLAAAGAQTLLDGENRAYALCRPPGHHAGYDTIGGYCYINNAAVAANHLKPHGKVAILDIDYHHGNGTQDIFWDDHSVFYVSLHADPAVDYPYYTGFTEENHQSNLNFPLPHGTDGKTYLDVLEKAVTAIQKFSPEFLVVSLGFDTYHGDPMGRFQLDIPDFAEIGSRLAAMGLPALYIQEGGYNVDKLGEMAVSFFSGILQTQL